MIKSLIFDLGGVILTHKVEITMKTLSRDIFQINDNENTSLFKKFEDEWVKGKISGVQLVKNLKNKFGPKHSPTKILNQYKKLYEERTVLNKDLIAVIDKLRNRYKIYLFTNTTDVHYGLNAKRGIFVHFDKVFASHIIGKRKPDEDFYTQILEEIKLKPKECIFIDDKKENIDTAKHLRMHTILFKNNKDFLRKVKELGIKI